MECLGAILAGEARALLAVGWGSHYQIEEETAIQREV